MPDYQYHPRALWPKKLVSSGAEERMAYFDSVKLGHPVASSVKQEVLSILEATYGSRIIMLTGPAGVGKTIVCRNVVQSVLDKKEHKPSDIPCVYIPAGASDDYRFDWKDFFNRFLKKCAAYLVHSSPFSVSREGQSDVSEIINYAKAKRTKRDLQLVVEDILKLRNTKVLVIDEAQHIFQNLSEKAAYREMEFIKSFSETTGIKIILSGTYNLLQCTQISAQLSRRLRIIHVPRYDLRQEQHGRNFMSVLNEFLRHLPAEYDAALHNDVDFFYIYSCGCIGILKDLLNNALLKASYAGFRVGYDELRAVALRSDGLLRIAQEIEVGENYFNNDDLISIRTILGLSSPKKKAANPKKNKGIGRTPGRRKPGRDRTGHQSGERKKNVSSS